MLIIGEGVLAECVADYPDSEVAIMNWKDQVREASWRTPHDVRVAGSRMERLHQNRLLFKVMRNRYRIIVHVDYREQLVTVLLAGSHAEYLRYLKRMKRRL